MKSGLVIFIKVLKVIHYFFDSINFSASKAAIQPKPAAVTACLKVLSCTSPAAKIPFLLVKT